MEGKKNVPGCSAFSMASQGFSLTLLFFTHFHSILLSLKWHANTEISRNGATALSNASHCHQAYYGGCGGTPRQNTPVISPSIKYFPFPQQECIICNLATVLNPVFKRWKLCQSNSALALKYCTVYLFILKMPPEFSFVQFCSLAENPNPWVATALLCNGICGEKNYKHILSLVQNSSIIKT